jgi:hypothetical protein
MRFSKKIIYIVLLISTICFSQENSKIVGEWSATDVKGSQGKFTFLENNYAYITLNGEVIASENHMINRGKHKGKAFRIKYIVDYSKSPIIINLIVLIVDNNNSTETGRISGILKFKNDNEIQLILDLEGKRETDFTLENKKNILTLKRM